MHVPAEEAESMKRHASADLVHHLQDEDDSAPVAPVFTDHPDVPDAAVAAVHAPQRTVAQLIEPVVQRFVSEVRGSVDFYTSQPGAASVGKVVLTGGGSMLGGIPEALGDALGIPAEVGQPFARVPMGHINVSVDQSKVAERYMSVAVGLALAGA